MWPSYQRAASSSVAVFSATQYFGYDAFVEGVDHALDLGAGGAPVVAPPLRPLWLHAAGMRVYGTPASLFSFRLRGAFALLRTEVARDPEPYLEQCLSQISVGVNFAAPFATDISATGSTNYLDVSCSGAWCSRCLQLYQLAGMGSLAGNQVWGQREQCIFSRAAHAVVVLRAWLCEDQKKQRVGLGAYWAERRARLSVDRSNLANRLQLSDVASATTEGPLGVCSDIGQSEALGNLFGDEYHIGGRSATAGAHCALVHDMLWPVT